MTRVVSVVVPAYNAAPTLGDCLQALAAQSLTPADYEVLVVDDGSTDATARIAAGFDVQVLSQQRQGPSGARNTGLAAACGEWVAFTDADCIPSRGWLQALLAAVERAPTESVLGAAGRTIGYQSAAAAARFVDLTGGLDAERHLAHPQFPFAPSGNVMYQRLALVAAGGFDRRYRTYEACELHTRLTRAHRGAFYFEPRAVVLHRHRACWTDFWRQQLGYGRGYAQFVLHHRDQIPWSVWRELAAWRDVAALGLAACWRGDRDQALVRRGTFVKTLAQRCGFVTTYWSPAERAQW